MEYKCDECGHLMEQDLREFLKLGYFPLTPVHLRQVVAQDLLEKFQAAIIQIPHISLESFLKLDSQEGEKLGAAVRYKWLSSFALLSLLKLMFFPAGVYRPGKL